MVIEKRRKDIASLGVNVTKMKEPRLGVRIGVC